MLGSFCFCYGDSTFAGGLAFLPEASTFARKLLFISWGERGVQHSPRSLHFRWRDRVPYLPRGFGFSSGRSFTFVRELLFFLVASTFAGRLIERELWLLLGGIFHGGSRFCWGAGLPHMLGGFHIC